MMLARFDNSIGGVVLGGLVLGAAIALSPSPVLGFAAALFLVLAVAALMRPFVIAGTALAIGALLPEYLGVKTQLFPAPISLPLAVAVLLGVCAAAVAVSDPRRHRPFAQRVVPLVFAVLWVGGSMLGGQGGWQSRVSHGLAVSLAGAVVAVSLGVITAREQGRLAVSWGVAIAGVIAAAYGAVEFLTDQNVLLNAGVSANPSLAAYLTVPVRFGIHRVSGAFSHPIMFSIMLGLAVICVIGLMQQRRIPRLTAGLLVVFMGAVDVVTVSRAPILACLGVCAAWFISQRLASHRTRWLAVGSLAAILAAGALLANSVGVFRGWLDPLTGTEAGTSLAYRIRLAQALYAEFAHASAFGSANADTNTLLAGFKSLDNQIANLLVSRGYAGLGAYALLSLSPLFSVRRLSSQSIFGLAIALFIAVVALTVAVFGSVQLYVFSGLSLALALVTADRPQVGVPENE